MPNRRVRIRIWGKFWTICAIPQRRMKLAGKPKRGICDPHQRIIWIASAGNRRQTLGHEVAHAFAWESYRDEEAMNHIAFNLMHGLHTPFIRLNLEMAKAYKSALRVLEDKQ